MKKLVISILVFCVLLLLCISQAYAAGTGSINITGPSTAKAGETITITVSLNTDYILPNYGMSEGLLYAGGSIAFDNKKVTYVSQNRLDFNEGVISSGEMGPGFYTYSVQPKTKNAVAKPGELVKVTFKIMDTVEDGTLLSFKSDPGVTRVKQDKNSEINTPHVNTLYDLQLTGSTLKVKVSNPNTVKNETINTTNNSSTNVEETKPVTAVPTTSSNIKQSKATSTNSNTEQPKQNAIEETNIVSNEVAQQEQNISNAEQNTNVETSKNDNTTTSKENKKNYVPIIVAVVLTVIVIAGVIVVIKFGLLKKKE